MEARDIKLFAAPQAPRWYKLFVWIAGDMSISDMFRFGTYRGTPLQRSLPFRQRLLARLVTVYLFFSPETIGGGDEDSQMVVSDESAGLRRGGAHVDAERRADRSLHGEGVGEDGCGICVSV